MSETPWPTHGPDFNAWNSDFARFAALLDSVKDEPWWIWDTDLKYLNVRIDTRDNGFLLFTDDHTDGPKKDRVSPDRVAAAIEKYLERFPSRRALTSPQLHQHGGGVERPMHSPLRQSETDPAWMQVIKLFQRHGAPEPPVRLRDEIVVALDWAWYGYALAQQPLSVQEGKE